MGDITSFDDIRNRMERDKARKKALENGEIIEGDTAYGLQYRNRKEAEKHDGKLSEMNSKHAFVVNYSGKAAIMTRVYNAVFGKKMIDFISIETFQQIYCNDLVHDPNANGGKGGNVALGKWWVQNLNRNEYATIIFDPNKPMGECHQDGEVLFNMWEGFAVTPKPGSWKRIIRHIYVVLCNSDPDKFRYVIKWLAFAVQYPGTPAQVAMIFKGKKGTGKGIILQGLVKMFGRHGLVISNREHLTGKHNQHLEYTSLLYADEAYYPGDKEVEGVLKNLITEPSLAIEAKYRNVTVARNCLHIVMSTNNEWVIPATEDERRYFINAIDNRYAKGSCPDETRNSYFDRLLEEINGEGLNAMLHDLLRIELRGWTPVKDIPQTDELEKQKELSLPKLEYAFIEILEEGFFPGAIDGNRYIISSKNLAEYIHSLDANNKSITNRAVSNLCTELGLELGRTNRSRFIIFPQLGELRKRWNRRKNSKRKWDLEAEWTVDNRTKTEY